MTPAAAATAEAISISIATCNITRKGGERNESSNCETLYLCGGREKEGAQEKNKLQTRSVCIYFFASAAAACVAHTVSLQDRLNVTMPVTVSISMLVKPFIIFLLSCELNAVCVIKVVELPLFCLLSFSLSLLSFCRFSRRSPCSW